MTLAPEPANRPQLDAHLVLLVNFVAPNLLGVVLELEKKVRKLTILCSVAVESNRQWDPEWGNLNVQVQKTKTFTRNLERGNGYREINHLHLPYDTRSQLKRLAPNVVISCEMGLRSILASRYCQRNNVRHIVAVNASQRTEAGASWPRRKIRKFLVRRADAMTYNGPSCREYLLSIGAESERLLPWSYAADPRKVYSGELEDHSHLGSTIRCLTVGQLVDRKGLLEGLSGLTKWAEENPSRDLAWTIVGTGHLQEQLQSTPLPKNLSLEFAGHCDPEQLRTIYSEHELLFFPTIGDEWGLVVDEAMFSGMAVLGSEYAQAVTTLTRDGENGWRFKPENPQSIADALSKWVCLSASERMAMRTQSRRDVAERTVNMSAEQLVTCCDMTLNGLAAEPVSAAP